MNLTSLQLAVLLDTFHVTNSHVDAWIDEQIQNPSHAFAWVNTAIRTMPKGLIEPANEEETEYRLTAAGRAAIGVEVVS